MWAVPSWVRASRDRREILAMILPPRREMSRELARASRELYAPSAADARAWETGHGRLHVP